MRLTPKDKFYTSREGNAPQGYVKTSEGIFPADWKIAQLQEVVRVFRGASPRPKGDPRYYGGEIPRVLIEDVTRDGKFVYPSIDSLTEEGAKKSRLLPKDSVILSCSGTRVAIPGILGESACIHDGFFGFDDYKELLPEYLYYYFWLLHDKMQSSATKGGVFNNLTTQIMKEMYIQFPDVTEQERIIEIINTWDISIELKEKYIEQKKEQKKGLIQKLLMGEVRLPGFNGAWKEIRLGDYLNKHDEKSITNNQYPVLTSSRKGIFLQKEYYSGNEVASKNNTGYNVVPYGYFTYRHMSDDLTFKFNINNIVDKGIVSTLYPVFTTKKGLSSRFLLLKLNEGIEFKRFALMQKQGGSRTYMYFSKLEEIKLKVPSIEEQNKIEGLFTTLDRNIELLERELNSLKEQKKGLMQQLLTGKVRVGV
ncbi:restriction endonuclease subunit S [Neobacillus mesonae]|uniref:restriction endonuclease subunit S n=1 Tax=Neobacillus mesonae TaxID=1193713 RepID=UPI00203B91E9|nr:restriction endonuclease subunit S [Neobacillus mesonae]MCM3570499.1 restriction endonuclease subunit S [Neobacillus mesonae]